MIYLDYNSTTIPDTTNFKKILDKYNEPINVSSIHSLGQKGAGIIRSYNEETLKALNANNHKVIWTSSATEANNLLINQEWDNIFYNPLEHKANLEPIQAIKDAGTTNTIEIQINKETSLIDLNHLEELLKNNQGKKNLVCIMFANNETGLVSQVEEISKLSKQYNAMFFCDSCQAIGRQKISCDLFDFFTITGHKIGTVGAIGALIYNNKYDLKPMILGGGQQGFKRSGTESIHSIMHFCELIKKHNSDDYIKEFQKKTGELQSYLEEGVQKLNGYIYCKNTPRLTNTSAIAMEDVSSAVQMIELDMNDIMISNGSACSSGSSKESYVYKQIDQKHSANTIRVSTGISTTKEEIDVFLNIWEGMTG